MSKIIPPQQMPIHFPAESAPSGTGFFGAGMRTSPDVPAGCTAGERPACGVPGTPAGPGGRCCRGGTGARNGPGGRTGGCAGGCPGSPGFGGQGGLGRECRFGGLGRCCRLVRYRPRKHCPAVGAGRYAPVEDDAPALGTEFRHSRFHSCYPEINDPVDKFIGLSGQGETDGPGPLNA